MSAGHAQALGECARTADWLLLCPNCGSDHHTSNLVDEAPYAAAAQYASGLREFGEIEAACDVLTRLAAVRIANFLALAWRCDACGARFDG